MIHSFSCKNFYSFGKEVKVSFVVNNNAPDNNGYFITPLGFRLSKMETVIGPNASGKTNLLKVLPFLKWVMVNSVVRSVDAPILIQTFAFDDSEDNPSEMSVVFETNNKVYNYFFSATKKRIIKEELKSIEFAKVKKSTKKLFERHWDEKAKKYEFNDYNFKLPKEIKDAQRANAGLIGSAAKLNHIESQLIVDYWEKLGTNVVEAGWIGDILFPNSTKQLFEVLDFFSENDDLKKHAEKLLCRFDLGLKCLEIIKEKKENTFSIDVKATHLFNGQDQFLPIAYESSGTKQLLVLLKNILVALKNGNMVIIDEFEYNLHPEVLIALHDLFIHPETNPKNAQLLMSTHGHIILSKLDKYQIVLVEKDENGMSDTWRLDDVAGSRLDENYYAKYMAGAYGAVPKI